MKTALRIAQCQLAFSPKAVHVQISIHHRIHNGTTMKSYQPLRSFILYAIGTCASSILTRLIRKPQLEKRAETSIERLTVKGCRTRESDHFQRQTAKARIFRFSAARKTSLQPRPGSLYDPAVFRKDDTRSYTSRHDSA